MKKVLVIGCKGMAGHVVKHYLESTQNYDVWGIARGVKAQKNLINLDVSNTKEIENILNKGAFDVVLNCIGLLNKTAEDNPQLAIWFNSYFPHLLSSLGKKYSFKLIHISTDCVFSGKEGPYKEDSFKNGIGVYAQSKALGEVINSKDLTFRTSIIGPELKVNGIGLFHWFMSQKNRIEGFTKAVWSGITTLDLAKAIDWAITNEIIGLYHLTNNKSINKNELLNLFKKHTNKNIEIDEVDGKEVDKSFIDTRRLINYQIPNYEIMIKDMIQYIKKNKSNYPYYHC